MTHVLTPLDTDKGSDAAPDQPAGGRGERGADATFALRAVVAVLAGLVVLIVAFANLSRIAGWSAEFGTVAVYLGFFLVMSVAGRLFWWGTDILVGRMIRGGRDRR